MKKQERETMKPTKNKKPVKKVKTTKTTKMKNPVKVKRLRREQLPKWNVWLWNFSHDCLENYDVVPTLVSAFDGMRPYERPQSLEELDEVLRREAQYYFWAKCEYEMIIHAWPERENDEKVDVYSQLELNWDVFARWFWENVYQPVFMRGKKA